MSALFNAYILPTKQEPIPATHEPQPVQNLLQAPAHKSPAHDAAEVHAFLDLLTAHFGMIKIADHGRSLGLHFRSPLTMDNLEARRHLAAVLYSGSTVPQMAARLTDGRWEKKRLLAWLGGEGEQPKGVGVIKDITPGTLIGVNSEEGNK